MASIGHLVALKLLSRGPGRPNDDADLIALVGVAGPDDRAVASSAVDLIAVDLITARGYGRDRDLAADLVELLRSAG